MASVSLMIVAGFLAKGTEAFAPIQWAKSPGKRFALMPRKFARHHFGSFAVPQELTIGETTDTTVPHFTVKSDNTISVAGWCVEAVGEKRGDGVLVNTCDGGPAQQWNWIPDAHGRNMIQLKNTNLCLDIADKKGNSNGDSVELQDCENRASESWLYEAPMSAPEGGALFTSDARYVTITLIALAIVGALRFGARFLGRSSPTTPIVTGGVPSSYRGEGSVPSVTLVASHEGRQFARAFQSSSKTWAPTSRLGQPVCSATAPLGGVDFSSVSWKALQEELDKLPVFTCANEAGVPVPYESGGKPFNIFFADAMRAEQELEMVLGQFPPEAKLGMVEFGLGDVYQRTCEGIALLVPSGEALARAGEDWDDTQLPLFSCLALSLKRPDASDVIPLFMDPDDGQAFVDRALNTAGSRLTQLEKEQLQLACTSLDNAVNMILTGRDVEVCGNPFNFSPSRKSLRALDRTTSLNATSTSTTSSSAGAVQPADYRVPRVQMPKTDDSIYPQTTNDSIFPQAK